MRTATRVKNGYNRLFKQLKRGTRTVLTPNKHQRILMPCNYPADRKLIERSDNGWLLRNFWEDGEDKQGRYEQHLELLLRAYCGDERIATLGDFAGIGYFLSTLGKSPEYRNIVHLILSGERREREIPRGRPTYIWRDVYDLPTIVKGRPAHTVRERIRGLRYLLRQSITFADNVRYGRGRKATISNPNRRVTVEIPEQANNYLVLAERQPEAFAAYPSVTEDWIERIVEPYGSQLAKILQYLTPRRDGQFMEVGIDVPSKEERGSRFHDISIRLTPAGLILDLCQSNGRFLLVRDVKEYV